MTPPWTTAATHSDARTSRSASAARRRRPARAGGTSAKRTATGIAPKQRRRESASRTASIYGRAGTRRRRSPAAAGSASTMPASITAQPVQPAQPSRSDEQQHAEQRRERRLEREDEGRAGRGRPRLHPGRDEVAERAREHAGDDERVPRLRIVGAPRSGRRRRDHRERGARDGHLEERERARVVAWREALHRDDLERLGDGVRRARACSRPRSRRASPLSSSRPTSESTTPTHTARRYRCPEGASARSGVKTT